MPARIVPRSSELLKGAIQSSRIELSRVVPESESRGAILGTSFSAVPMISALGGGSLWLNASKPHPSSSPRVEQCTCWLLRLLLTET